MQNIYTEKLIIKNSMFTKSSKSEIVKTITETAQLFFCFFVFWILYSFIHFCNFVLFYVGEAWQCSKCAIPYETVGCYKDTFPRRLPREILNERDKKSKNFDGITVDWGNWNQYIAEFACRCAAKAKQREWSVFGLQFYGIWVS